MKQFLFTFSLILSLFSFPTFILSFFPITELVYHITKVQQNQSLELSQVSEDLLQQTLDYMFNQEKNYTLDIPDPINLQLTVDEQSHMNDVKKLFSYAKALFVGSIFLNVSLFFFTKSKVTPIV